MAQDNKQRPKVYRSKRLTLRRFMKNMRLKKNLKEIEWHWLRTERNSITWTLESGKVGTFDLGKKTKNSAHKTSDVLFPLYDIGENNDKT